MKEREPRLPWDQRFVESLSRPASSNGRSRGAATAISLFHALLITTVSTASGIGLFGAVGIVATAALAVRLLAELRRARRRRIERLGPPNPFGE